MQSPTAILSTYVYSTAGDNSYLSQKVMAAQLNGTEQGTEG